MNMVLKFDVPSKEYLNNVLEWNKTEDEICEYLSCWSYDELVDFLGEPEIIFEKVIDRPL